MLIRFWQKIPLNRIGNASVRPIRRQENSHKWFFFWEFSPFGGLFAWLFVIVFLFMFCCVCGSRLNRRNVCRHTANCVLHALSASWFINCNYKQLAQHFGFFSTFCGFAPHFSKEKPWFLLWLFDCDSSSLRLFLVRVSVDSRRFNKQSGRVSQWRNAGTAQSNLSNHRQWRANFAPNVTINIQRKARTKEKNQFSRRGEGQPA